MICEPPEGPENKTHSVMTIVVVTNKAPNKKNKPQIDINPLQNFPDKTLAKHTLVVNTATLSDFRSKFYY